MPSELEPSAAGRGGPLIRLALGAAVFWIAFRDVDVAALAHALRSVDPRWIACAVGSVLATVSVAAVRWRLLLDDVRADRQSRTLFFALIVSQTANLVVPFKLGDAARIGAVGRALGIRPAVILGSVAVERLLDGFVLALAASGLAIAGRLPEPARAGLWSLAVVIGALLAALAALRLTPRRAPAWPPPLEDLLEGLHLASTARVLPRALAASSVLMAGSMLTAWLVTQGLGLSLPAAASSLVVIVLQVGGAVVPVPGAVGVSQVLAVQTLGLWGVPEAPALAYALVLYFVSRGPKLALLPFALSALTAKTPKVV